jgi:tRNA threonylcarbamoyladenosine biosynthesis protein TsaB
MRASARARAPSIESVERRGQRAVGRRAATVRMTVLLVFDTATERTHVALDTGERIWVHEGTGGARASAEFLPDVLTLLARAGVPLDDVHAIAYGRGPGAFTGLRVACAVAQGLAFGAGKPVLAIDTLMAVAEDARRRLASGDEGLVDASAASAASVWALQDARMGELYAAEYVHADGRWSARVAPRVLTPEALVQLWDADPPAVVAGDALTAYGVRLDTGLALRVPEAVPGGEALAALARAAWQAGDRLDAADALPLYVRDKVALTTAEREAAR